MQLSNSILVLVTVGLAGSGAAVACGGTGGSTAGAGGSGTTGNTTATTSATTGTTATSTSTTTTTTTTTSTTATSSSGTGGMMLPCSPTAACTAPDKECLGLVDNTGKTKFGLRMAELDVTKPAALTQGPVATIVANDILPSNPSCNLMGTGNFSWLLQFDTTAGTLKTGGAKPVADPTAGYAFADDMVTQGSHMFHVQPITFMAKPDAAGTFTTTVGQDLLVPIYLDPSGTQVLLLPLKGTQLTMGTLSSSQSCVGAYNAAGLDPAKSCKPDAMHPAFTSGASLSGLVTLEDADTVLIPAISQSLCVLLSGDSAMYGMDNGTGMSVCKRDGSNVILFKGDSCSITGQACTDSVAVVGKFAASSVLITN